MLRKWMMFITLLMIMQLLTGCWSRRELNELAIASAMGIDLDGKEFKVSLQIVNPSEVATKTGSGGYQTPVTVYVTKAETLLEAVRKATTTAPRKVYLAQLRTIVLGEELARSGVSKAMDFLVRDREVREENLLVLIARKGKAEDVLKVLTHLNKIPATKIANAMKILERFWGPISATYLDDIMYNMIAKEKYPAVAGIEVKGAKSEGKTAKNVQTVESLAYLKFKGMGMFYRDRLVGWLDEEESKGYNYITNQVIKTAGRFKCLDGGAVAIDVIRTQTTMTAHMQNGKPLIDISLWMEGNIADFQCEMDLTNPASLKELERLGGERLVSTLKNALNKIQRELKTDTLGFGNAIHTKYPQEWKKLEKKWDEIFPEVPVNVKAEVRIRTMGTMINSFYESTKD